MRTWRIDEIGTPARLANGPVPEPMPNEVLVRIHACGLNFADLLMAEGKYQEMPALPFTPGLEIAGVVVARGPGAEALQVGTRVAGHVGSGGLAEYGAFPVDRLVEIPGNMSFETAAAFPIAYGTSHLALTHKAALKPGETLLVTGAAGGVGLTAVEIGKRLGARVIAAARGADKLKVATAAGADIAIDIEAPDLKAQLKALGGVDVTYETIGGSAFDAALGASRPDGRILAIGFAGGQVPQVAANHLLVKNVSVIGFWWGGYLKFAPLLLRDSLTDLMSMYAKGQLSPHISHSLPFEDLDHGLSLLRDRKATGKIVITINHADIVTGALAPLAR